MITESTLRLLLENNITISHDEYRKLKTSQPDAIAKKKARAKKLYGGLEDISNHQTQTLCRVLTKKFAGQKYDGDIIKNFYTDNYAEGNVYYNTEKTNNKGGDDYNSRYKIEIYDNGGNTPAKDPIGSFVYKWFELHAKSYHANYKRYDKEMLNRADERYSKVSKKYNGNIPSKHRPGFEDHVTNRFKQMLGEAFDPETYYRNMRIHEKDLQNGTGRIDKNGDYFKKEVTQKSLKKRKASERHSGIKNDMVSMHFARVVEPVISAVNRLYAGKDNVAKVELVHDEKWDAKPDTVGSGEWIDPQYVSFAVIDTNGKRWESKVDARTSLGGYRPHGDFNSSGTSISPETLRKIEEGIFKLVHAKREAFYKNSRKINDQIEQKREKKERYGYYTNNGGKKERIRRNVLGEESNN